jgi:hypothetical protein
LVFKNAESIRFYRKFIVGKLLFQRSLVDGGVPNIGLEGRICHGYFFLLISNEDTNFSAMALKIYTAYQPIDERESIGGFIMEGFSGLC